jgi:hypothetical protein
MTARTVFALAACAAFTVAAFAYLAPGAQMQPDPSIPIGGTYREILVGSDVGLAVTSAVRTLSGGLAVLSLAAVEWSGLPAWLRTLSSGPA